MMGANMQAVSFFMVVLLRWMVVNIDELGD